MKSGSVNSENSLALLLKTPHFTRNGFGRLVCTDPDPGFRGPSQAADPDQVGHYPEPRKTRRLKLPSRGASSQGNRWFDRRTRAILPRQPLSRVQKGRGISI